MDTQISGQLAVKQRRLKSNIFKVVQKTAITLLLLHLYTLKLLQKAAKKDSISLL